MSVSLPTLSLKLGTLLPDYRRYAAFVKKAGLTPAPRYTGQPPEAYWSLTLFALRGNDAKLKTLLGPIAERFAEDEELAATVQALG